jgi:hypothetical protein
MVLMALAPVLNQVPQSATSLPSATQNRASDQFSKATDKTRSSEAANTTGRDGKNTSVNKFDQSKVQARSDKDKEQGGQDDGSRLSRIVNGVRVTTTDGRVIGRVSVGTNAPNSTAASQNAGMNKPEMMRQPGPATGAELRQPVPTAANTILTMPRPLEARSTRPGETSGKVSSDFASSGTTSSLNAEAAIRDQPDSGGSSGGGGGQQGKGDQGGDTSGGDRGGGGNQNTGGFGGGGGNIGPSGPGGSSQEPEDFSFSALQRAVQRAAIAEAKAMGLDPAQAVRFSKLDPAVRAAVRDFGDKFPAAMFSELSLNSLDNLAKIIPVGELVSDIIADVLHKICHNPKGDDWGAADLFKLLSTTQDFMESQSPANRTAKNLLDTVDALTLPPSSPDILGKISKALQSGAISGQSMIPSNLINSVANLTEDQLAFKGNDGRGQISGPSAADRVSVPPALRAAAIAEGDQLGLDQMGAFQYASTELGLRPALRQFISENPGLRLGTFDIYSLNNISLLLPANEPTTETMASFMRQLVENASQSADWGISDLLKILSSTETLLKGQNPENRQADTLLEIINALIKPPSTPSRLRAISEGLQRPEFSYPTFESPSEINTFIEEVLQSSGTEASGNAQASVASQLAPNSALPRMIQYFLDETPGAKFTSKSMDSVFRLAMTLPDNQAASEVMLSVLRTLRDNTTDEKQWLSPELLPTVLGALHDLFEPVSTDDKTEEFLQLLISSLIV